MTLQLGVPMESLVTELALECGDGQMAALDVRHERVLTTELGVADMTDELLIDNRLASDGTAHTSQHAPIILQQPKDTTPSR